MLRFARSSHRHARMVRSIHSDVIGHLRSRGLISQVTKEEQLSALIKKTPISLYCGADPTAQSLHLGNLLPLMILLHFNLAGHNVVGLVGGATGCVGDPSGRTTERDAMASDIRLDNTQRIRRQLENFFANGVKYAEDRLGSINNGEIKTVNNHDWWADVKMLDFLAIYGRHIRINAMLARDSISNRLKDDAGLGFNEFTYQILQAYDFYWLHKNGSVQVQVGGNDQWGNITAGVDLIGRLGGVQGSDKPSSTGAFGITVPLLTTANGVKFGKSAGNAVFIDKQHTSAFEMYQYFVRALDEDVDKFLKCFTLLPLDKIASVMEEHKADPSKRHAQKVLAGEVVDLIHGVGESANAELATKLLFGKERLSYEELSAAAESAGLVVAVKGRTFGEVVREVAGLSQTQARKLFQQGSVYGGIERVKVGEKQEVGEFAMGDLVVVRLGKGNVKVARLA